MKASLCVSVCVCWIGVSSLSRGHERCRYMNSVFKMQLIVVVVEIHVFVFLFVFLCRLFV